MRILLIAGHGAGDPGACSTINGVKYREADETRYVVSQIFSELTNRFLVDVGVYATDRNAYADKKCGALPDEVFKGYDYVAEIHFNALKSEKADGYTKGCEVYVTQQEKSLGVELQIAQRISALGLRNRGVKRKNFDVITAAKRAEVSSALIECCFIDDPDDMEVYLRNRRAMGVAIADAIAAGFGLTKKPRTNRDIVQQMCGYDDRTMAYLDKHPYPDALYQKMVDAIMR